MATKTPREDITLLLADASRGDSVASERVWSALYGELRRLARLRLHQEHQDHTLSPTALVHEAYLKLVGGESIEARDRHHFLAVAARAMRQILVDHARRRSRLKRGGGHAAFSLEEARERPLTPEMDPDLLVALDEALTRLQEERERMASVVELRFFGGLSTTETAEVLSVTRRTVERDWAFARAFLFRHLSTHESDSST